MGATKSIWMECEATANECSGNWKKGLMNLRIDWLEPSAGYTFDVWAWVNTRAEFIIAQFDNTDDLAIFVKGILAAGYTKVKE